MILFRTRSGLVRWVGLAGVEWKTLNDFTRDIELGVGRQMIKEQETRFLFS